jgi:uncharacterized membrane protein
MSDGNQRRGYLDWMRGLAVLVMIAGHTLDSWTRLDVRDAWQFRWAMIVAGFGAPLFLFLAGITAALSAGSKFRRSGDARAASGAIVLRGFWICWLAFLFRVQAWALALAPARTLLKVDILNIMGPSIVAAGALWGAFRSPRARGAAFAATTLTIALLTPIVWITPLLDSLPDPLEGYIRPIRGLPNFCIFPWAGFLFAGGLVGVLLDQVRARDAETGLNMRLFAGGTAVALAAYGASFFPAPYARSEFWGSSPAFFLLRNGVITLALAMAYAWDTRRRAVVRWSPLEQLGRSSLFIYWIHVEMVYGLISLRIHKSLSFGAAIAALAAFAALMLVCAAAKDRVMAWWSQRSRALPGWAGIPGAGGRPERYERGSGPASQ